MQRKEDVVTESLLSFYKMIKTVFPSRFIFHKNSIVQYDPLLYSWRSISQRPKLSKPKFSAKGKVRHVSAAKTKPNADIGEEKREVHDLTKPPINIHDPKFNELQLDEPPVLFIRKYEQFIDTKGLVVRDELSDLEKNGTLTPSSLTSEKIQFIQSAVKTSHTFRQLTEAIRKQPRLPEALHAPPTAVTTEKSVFVDSDFEVIKPDPATASGSRLSLAKFETELEWSSAKLDPSKLLSHYLMLSKSRLTLLVCLTAGAGYGMAPGDLNMITAIIATGGTAMASAAANSINQIIEVPFDSQMNRTKNRVLVRGQVSTLHATGFAAVLASSSTAMLYTLVNPITAALSFFNLVLYTSVYTPMKRYSILNTWVGSLVGAVPPLIGWTAATGSLEPGALVLAGILYTWQFPHFNSLSWNLRPDYSRAGKTSVLILLTYLCLRLPDDVSD